jgi:hypothetical protein
MEDYYDEVIVLVHAIYNFSNLEEGQLDDEKFNFTIRQKNRNGSYSTTTIPVGFGMVMYGFEGGDRNSTCDIDVYSLVYRNFNNDPRPYNNSYRPKSGKARVIKYFNDNLQPDAYDPGVISNMIRRPVVSVKYRDRTKTINNVPIANISPLALRTLPKFCKPKGM